MSLDWSIRDCEGWDTTLATDKEKVITGAVAMAAHITGMGGKITADRAPEFYARIKVMEACGGTLMVTQGGPAPIEMVDIERRIGMYTNGDKFHRVEAMKRIAGGFADIHLRAFRDHLGRSLKVEAVMA